MTSTSIVDFFGKDEAFGPVASPKIRDPEILKILFSKENLIFHEMSKRPSLIIGRRGSGKTAFLTSIYLNPANKIAVDLPAQQPFREIIDSIGKMSTGVVFVEETSELWKILLWHAILFQMSDLKEEHDKLKIVKTYLSGMGFKQSKDPYNIMRKVVKIIKERGGDKAIGIISELVDEIVFNEVSFKDAQEAAIEFMEDKKIRGIILLDALEDFQLGHTDSQHALRGLLKCQGEFHFPGSPFEIRCCIPVELYHKLLELSSNPNKDFQHKLLLHWHANELIRLGAQRYMTYLELYHGKVYGKFSSLDLNKRSDTIKFWHSLFPMSMGNRVGGFEDPLAYILRHTQLLPRHFLMYLNKISYKNAQLGNPPDHFTEEAILSGVYETEGTICQEIFTGFKYVYPGAREACERSIPYLPYRFSDGELHKVYNRRGKGIPRVYEYEEFKKLLIEIGAIGRFTKETERYNVGLFEYTIPHKLIVSSEDDLCLHPCFVEVFSAIRPKEDVRTTLPYGADIDTEEYRVIR